MTKKLMSFFALLIIWFALYAQEYLEYTGCGVVRAVISGSVKEYFLKTHPGCEIDIVGKGDMVGIREANAGVSDLGGTCRHKLNVPEEKYSHMVPFAWDAIVVVVNKDNPIKNISSEQLKKVLTGEITNWKSLNGENKPIQLYIRNSKHSGVGQMTRELLFGDPNVEYASNAVRFSSTTPLETSLESNRYAFAVTGVYSARKKKGLKILSLDNVAPTNENIRSGKYPLFRPLYLIYNYEDASQTAKDFIDLILSEKGKELLRNDGIIPLDDAASLWKVFEKKMKKIGIKKEFLK